MAPAVSDVAEQREPAWLATMDLPDPVPLGLIWDEITIARLVDRAAARWPGRPFLKTPSDRITFDAARERSVRMAAGLRDLGVRRGDRVAILMGNSVEFAVTYLAAARLGAVLVPLHTRYRRQEMANVLRDSGASTLVLVDRLFAFDYVETLLEICPELPGCTPGELRSAALPDLRRVVLLGAELAGTTPFDVVAAGGGELGDVADDAEPGDLAQVKYTSGSTAAPKGAMLTHAATIRNAYNMGARIGLGPDDVVFSGMPFYHAGGSVLTLLTGLALGCCAVSLPRYHAGEAIEAIERERCTAHLGMEIMFLREIEHPDYSWERVSTLRTGWIAGSSEAVTRVYRSMPFPFVNIYGLTELSGNVCMTRIDDPDEIRLGWAGEIQPGLELKIFDPSTQRVLGAGEIGEIAIRGWAVMEGYLGDPEATGAVIDADGWLRPGDLGVIDERGYLRYLGRSKEMLKVGGENVSPREIERFLVEQPQVRMAAVVGVPDDIYGELPFAYVEIADGGPTADELLELCRAQLAAFKVPCDMHLVATGEWPLTGPEKIAKQQLRERAIEHRRAGA